MKKQKGFTARRLMHYKKCKRALSQLQGSQHTGGPEMGLLQNLCDPAETLQEISTLTKSWSWWASMGFGTNGRSGGPNLPWPRSARLPRGCWLTLDEKAPQCLFEGGALLWCLVCMGAGRGQDEAKLHPRPEDQGFLKEAPTDPGIQTGLS